MWSEPPGTSLVARSFPEEGGKMPKASRGTASEILGKTMPVVLQNVEAAGATR
jgi:hypothetical protein